MTYVCIAYCIQYLFGNYSSYKHMVVNFYSFIKVQFFTTLKYQANANFSALK